jgi:hypothetical protein
MSSTAGGGGGGGGVTGRAAGAGFRAGAAGFFLLVAGFFTVVAGCCAQDVDGRPPVIRHAATKAAANEVRAGKASMAVIVLTARAIRFYQRVSTVRRSVRGSTGWKWRSATGELSLGNWLS